MTGHVKRTESGDAGQQWIASVAKLKESDIAITIDSCINKEQQRRRHTGIDEHHAEEGAGKDRHQPIDGTSTPSGKRQYPLGGGESEKRPPEIEWTPLEVIPAYPGDSERMDGNERKAQEVHAVPATTPADNGTKQAKGEDEKESRFQGGCLEINKTHVVPGASGLRDRCIGEPLAVVQETKDKMCKDEAQAREDKAGK